jgi:flavin reductase (DIM6/NTAB) family NADH-FMN oxidoreductase RutF
MILDPEGMEPIERYHFMTSALVPRPIAWVTTVDAEGRTNAAPFSFFAGISSSPPLLGVSVGSRRNGTPKDTLANAEATGEMVVNVVPYALKDEMVACAAGLPPGESEIEKVGLAVSPAEMVKPPLLTDAKVSFECLVDQIIGFGGTSMIVGRIVRFHAADEILAEGRVSFAKLRPLGRLGGLQYLDCERGVFEIG